MPPAQTQATRLIELLATLEHAVVAERRPADQVFAGCCRAHHEWGSRDRRIFGDVLFAYFRWRGWLTGLPPARVLALAGWLDGLAHPALVELATQAALKLPAVTPEKLDDKARELSALLGAEKKLSTLLPDWALPLLAVSAGGAQQHLEAFQRRPPVWLRVAPEQVAATLAFFNTPNPRAAAHPHIPGAICVKPPANLQGLYAATGVAAIVQDLASQVVGLLCAPQPGERWWDVCAGAGGKTLHLAAQMQNRGALLATDVRAGALRELEKRAAEAGVSIVRTRRIGDEGRDKRGECRGASVEGRDICDLRFMIDDLKEHDAVLATDGRQLAGQGSHIGLGPSRHEKRPTRDPGHETRDTFDGVLVDAPCSGIGTWNRNPDMRWRTDAADVAAKAALQADILERASRSVRPGGALIFAVCTVTAAETSGVTETFSRAHPEFVAETVPHPLTGEELQGTFFIWPWQGPCDGMFAARWRRTAKD